MGARKKKRPPVLLFILIAIFIAAAVVFTVKLADYRAASRLYSGAAQLVEQDAQSVPVSPAAPETGGAQTPEDAPSAPAPEPTQLEAMAALKLEKLREINPEAVGWITIPGTVVSYPLMQSGDNSKYLSYAYDMTRSSVGSIFLDWQSAPDMAGFNTVIYGHRMNDGSMFSCLNDYRSPDFLAEHPYIYIATEGGAFQYQVFSAYTGSARADSLSYQTVFSSDEEKQAFIDAAIDASEADAGLTPSAADRFITLSTCTGNGHANRMKVHAVLVDFIEK